MSLLNRLKSRSNGTPEKSPAIFDIQKRVEQADKGELVNIAYADVDRITALPVIRPMSPEELEEFSYRSILASWFDAGGRLFPTQAESLRAYRLVRGGVLAVGVGYGKTLSSIQIAGEAYAVNQIPKMVYFCPSGLVNQFLNSEIPLARSRVPIPYPINVLAQRGRSERLALARSNRRGLYVFPYSLLSAQDAWDVLRFIDPGIIIADEAHRLANSRAARTNRIMEFWKKKPDSELVLLSGTLTRKSIKDYHHLARKSLGEGNFLPNSTSLMHEWAAVIDAQGGSTSTGPLMPVIRWARENFPEDSNRLSDDQAGFRHAFRLRLGSTPGVVSSGDASIPTSITFCTRPIKDHKRNPSWTRLQELIDKVEQAWMTPNDDPIDFAIHKFKWHFELTAGFYNQLSWPTTDQYAKRKNISVAEAQETLDKAVVHLMAERGYLSELRKWLDEEARPGLDTPLLVGKNMSLHKGRDVGKNLYECWKYMHDCDFPGRPDRDEQAVRVCDYKIMAALEWAFSLPKNDGAIIWFFHNEVGRWLHDEFVASGIPTVLCMAGQEGNESILDKANGNKKILASIMAHGEGKNLQHFEHQFFVQWPRPAIIAEQTLGRLHRSGQKADELFVYIPTTTEFDEVNFAATVNDALYIHQTLGTKQKLIYGGYDPMPKVFPSEVLREKGFNNKMLTDEVVSLRKQKFGS